MSTRNIIFSVTLSAIDDSADPEKAGQQIKSSMIWAACESLRKLLESEIKNDEYIIGFTGQKKK